jgi:hypothetical protein
MKTIQYMIRKMIVSIDLGFGSSMKIDYLLQRFAEDKDGLPSPQQLKPLQVLHSHTTC